MTDIYLKTLVYEKPEIDTAFTDAKTYTDAELAKKADVIDVGSPAGIATLDGNGQVPPVELPWATNTDAFEGTSTVLTISPATLKYAVDVGTVPIDSVGQPDGICPLGSDTLVNPVYLPAQKIVSTYVRTTLAEMYAIPDVLESDRCVVTDDPTDVGGDVNGEWVADIDYPTDTDWSHLPNLASVQSVNGQTGIVEITTTTQGDTNADNITTWALVSDGNSTDITNLTARVGTNETDIATLQTDVIAVDGKTDTNAAAIVVNEDNITGLDTRVTTLEGNVPFAPSYNFDKVVNNTITDDQWQETGNLSVLGTELGTYEFKFSIQWTLDSATTSAFFRYSRDGGNTWVETQHEPKDTTDKNITMYGFPVSDISGDVSVITQMRKENANDVLVVLFNNIVLERKL